MFDWILIVVGGGLLAAGCATGSLVTKLLQRLLFKPKKEAAVKEAINAQDVEANRENQGDGMEDLLFDEKLKLLVLKESLKKKLLKQKQIIQHLMGCGDKGQPSPSAGAAAVAAASGISGAGDKSSADASCEVKTDRMTREVTEADYFAAELELSKWTN